MHGGDAAHPAGIDHLLPQGPGVTRVHAADQTVGECEEAAVVAARHALQTTPDGNTTHYSYDPDGALTAVIDPLGMRQTYRSDKAGMVLAHTDAQGRTTTLIRDLRPARRRHGCRRRHHHLHVDRRGTPHLARSALEQRLIRQRPLAPADLRPRPDRATSRRPYRSLRSRCRPHLPVRPPAPASGGLRNAPQRAARLSVQGRVRRQRARPLGPHICRLLGQLFFESVQFRTARGDPFQQFGIQHGQS